MNNLAFFTIALTFLSGIATRLSEQLKSDLKASKVVLDDHTLELKKEISGGATIDLLDALTENIPGICSFDKDKLKGGRAFIFDKIALNYATHATDAGLEGKIEYITKAPKELQNAVLMIIQDGRTVLSLPIRDVHNIQTGQASADDYKQLNSLRYLVDERPIEIKIKFAPNVVLDNTKKHYVYLRMSGLQTTKKVD